MPKELALCGLNALFGDLHRPHGVEEGDSMLGLAAGLASKFPPVGQLLQNDTRRARSMGLNALFGDLYRPHGVEPEQVSCEVTVIYRPPQLARAPTQVRGTEDLRSRSMRPGCACTRAFQAAWSRTRRL